MIWYDMIYDMIYVTLDHKTSHKGNFFLMDLHMDFTQAE